MSSIGKSLTNNKRDNYVNNYVKIKLAMTLCMTVQNLFTVAKNCSLSSVAIQSSNFFRDKRGHPLST